SNNYTADSGTVNVNFYRNSFAYDVRGRPSQRTSPTNTITQIDFDPRSRPMDVQIGTVGTALTTVVQYVYDQAAMGGAGGIGDGNLTQVTQLPNDGSPNRIQQNFFDWRDRLVASKDGVQGNGASENDSTHRPIYYLSYDNLNEVTAAQHYDGDGYTLASATGLPIKPAGDTPIIPATSANKLRAQANFKFD